MHSARVLVSSSLIALCALAAVVVLAPNAALAQMVVEDDPSTHNRPAPANPEPEPDAEPNPEPEANPEPELPEAGEDGATDETGESGDGAEAGTDDEVPPADTNDEVDPTHTRRPDDGRDMGDVTESGLLSDEQVLTQQELGVETVRRGTDPYEDPDNRYFYLGGFFHYHILPAGIIELFVQEAFTVTNPQFGLEFTIRKDGFEVVVGAWYADFRTEGGFLANGDPITDLEYIDSNLRAAFVGATFLWSTMFNDYIGLQYGLGVGIGYVFGDLIRTEGYPSQNSGWQPCQQPASRGIAEQPGRPFDMAHPSGAPLGEFCQDPIPPDGSTTVPQTNLDGEEGAHYNVEARNWFDGGSVPNFYFRLAPQISLRFKPIHQIVIRADVGFDIFSGVFFGGALMVGLN